jgi:hypothetical protein
VFDLPTECAALEEALFLFVGIVAVFAVTFVLWYLLKPKEEE